MMSDATLSPDNTNSDTPLVSATTPPPSEDKPDAEAMMSNIFQIMQRASRSSIDVDYATRKDRLDRLAKMLVENDDAMVAAIDADFGCRVAAETRILEIIPLMNALRHTRSHLRKWMRPERRAISYMFKPSSGRVVPQPLGIVGIVSPWNYPLYLAISPLIDALAAGNRALIKPSELGPKFSDLLQELIARTFAPDEVSVITGGVEIAQAFTKLPFDHLFFTGSTAVGRHVAMAAAENLTPVTLELGGKSPAIIAPDADLAKAADSIAFGKCINAGQTCVAPDHIWVPRDQLESFTQAMVDCVRKRCPDLSTGYTSIISQNHYDRQVELIDALPATSRIETIGQDDPTRRIFAPRLVIDPPKDSRVMQEEIFGPILPILSYDNLDVLLENLAHQDRPLALYCFAPDREKAEEIVNRTISGGMTVNGTLLHLGQDNLPFGGVGSSGIGAYHGHEGFKRFSHMKSVFRVGFLNVFEKMGPPWGGLAKMAYKVMRR
jgi:coniferyl-aldehyde dehydrogenase